MSSTRDRLLTAALDYLLAQGVAHASLRPMAEAIGTSPRMLLFHFKSKEGLFGAALQELHARLQSSFAEAMASGAEGPPIKRFWHWAIDPRNRGRLRLLYEVQIIAAQNPTEYGRYLQQASAGWLATALSALSSGHRSEPMATLCVAVFDGLFMELVATGDERRLTEALDHFIALAGVVGARRQGV